MNTEVVPTFSLAHTNDDRIQRHAFSVGGWVPTQFAYTVRKNNHGKFVLEEFLVPRICELLVGNLGDVSEPLSGNGGRIVNSHDDNDTYNCIRHKRGNIHGATIPCRIKYMEAK
jgi:hypothetical protein